jgi:hypothetical protein
MITTRDESGEKIKILLYSWLSTKSGNLNLFFFNLENMGHFFLEKSFA